MEMSTQGYDPALFARMAEVEARNFWFRARNELITWALKRFLGAPGSLLEIGCGTGFVLEAIAATFPDAKLTGAELFPEGLDYARRRVPGARFMTLDARALPFRSEFDVIGAFDVLEHILEDEQVLGAIATSLRPRGGLMLTVPQHPWLWSAADTAWHHVRRYRRGELEAKVNKAGFEVLASTSFMTLLLPAMLAARFAPQANTPEAGLDLPGPLNETFKRILDLEAAGIRGGLRLPIGGSRLIVARKL